MRRWSCKMGDWADPDAQVIRTHQPLQAAEAFAAWHETTAGSWVDDALDVLVHVSGRWRKYKVYRRMTFTAVESSV